MKRLFASSILDLGISLEDEQIDKFFLYLKEIKIWRKNIGLTALSSDRDIILKHFIDSLSPLLLIPSSSFLVDLGSGAGFPGLPLKIAQPSIELIMIDSSQKKIHFEKHIIRLLNLSGAKSICHRVENGPTDELFIDRADIVISRALSGVRNVILWGIPYLKEEGRLILMLGKNLILKDIRNISYLYGMEIEKILSFQLPILGHKRHLISLVYSH